MQGGHFAVEAEDAGTRLDAFLARGLGLSRAEVRRLLARGKVAVDGRAVDASAKGRALPAGAAVEVADFAPRAEQRIAPQPDLPLRELARGRGWVAVDKPAGMPVHPRDDEETGTVLNALAARFPAVQGVGEGGARSGVVHRLDVDTSGVLLVATDEPTWRRLRRAFRAHRVAKRYRALALGALPERGRAEVGLRVARHRPARVAVVDAARAAAERDVRVGRMAWRVVERLRGGPAPDACLVEVDLETGFLHQIRASLAHLGAPVAGDPVYGRPDDASGAPRQMLHAARVAWEEIRAESPDPPDFADVLIRLRG